MKAGSKIIYNAYPYLASDKQDEESKSIREISTAAVEMGKRAISKLNSMCIKHLALMSKSFHEHFAAFAGHEPEVWGDPIVSLLLLVVSLFISISKYKNLLSCFS